MKKKHTNRGKTKHLNGKELETLKSAYYSGINTKDLVEKYDIDIHPNNLCSTFPLVEAPNISCTYCKSHMYFIPPLKSAKSREEYFCTVCEHIESIFGCKCDQCLTKKGEDLAQKELNKFLSRKKVLNSREYSHAYPLNRLSIKIKAYLGAILRVHLYKDYLLINLEYNSSQYFAPTEQYRNTIIAELIEKKIIVPYKPARNADHELIEAFSCGTLYDLCITDIDRSKSELMSYLMYPNRISSTRENEAYDLLHEVRIHEATEYMMLTLQQFNLYIFEPEQRYTILFTQILNQYSQGQLFNFIYTAVRNLAAYSNKKKGEYLPVSNYIYKSISDRYEKALTDSWKITNFNRSWEGKQTELSKLVSNRLLSDGESNFYIL